MGTGNIPISKDSSRAVELVIFSLSEQMAKLGNEVHIIDLFSQTDNELNYHFVNMPKSFNLETNSGTFKHTIKKIIFSFKALSLLFRLNKKEKFDIIHAQNQYIGFFVLLFRKILGVPLVYTSHIPFWVLDKNEFNKKFYFKTLLERICLKFADKVICVGNSQRKGILEKVSINPDKIVTIENGVDLTKFHPSKIKNKEKLTIISVARLSRVKNQFMLVKAIPEVIKVCKNTQFIFIGQIEDEEYLKEINQYINENNIGKYVKILGPLNISQLPEYYNSSEIFVSVSKAEGLPLTVLEAMASRCAIVLSDIGPHKEFEKNNEIIYFKLDDIEDLVSKLVNLLKDRKKIEELRSNALATARKFFSWKSVALRNLKVYNEIINR